MENHLATHAPEVSAGEWGALSAISLGIHNIYNGIENILLSLAKDVDGLSPSGPTMHQDVLDQMVAAIAGVREAVLDPALDETLTELKGFRHLVRHRYGLDLKPEKVRENFDLIRDALPSVVAAVVLLERTLTDDLANAGDSSPPTSGKS